MKAYVKPIALASALLCALAPCAAADTLDYTDASNWAYYQIAPEKGADVFLICPTVDKGAEGNMLMNVQDDNMRSRFQSALAMERGIYEGGLTLYAPYYRQASFPVYALSTDEAEQYFSIAYSDVREAFIHFLSLTGSRPFVLAGFSQGSDMALRLLKELFADEALQSRLIAAYLPGWRVTREDVAACPWLKPAQGESDVGVIVCFSSEAEAITDSTMVPSGVWSYSINPLNWKTDGTMADKSLNLGACFLNKQGEITSEIPALTGAYIDAARGTLKAVDIKAEDYSNQMFANGIYHLYDYMFFYRNLQQNVLTRTAAYEALTALDDAA